jgi:hypothetical protein
MIFGGMETGGFEMNTPFTSTPDTIGHNINSTQLYFYEWYLAKWDFALPAAMRTYLSLMNNSPGMAG